MKIIVVLLLILSSFAEGNELVQKHLLSSVTTDTTKSTTTSTTDTTTSTVTKSTTTIVTNSTTTITTTVPSTTTTLSPTADVSVNVTWTFYSGINVTNIAVIVNNLQSAQWAAIGLGQEKKMANAHVFMCKRLSNDKIQLNRYKITTPHDDPTPVGPGPEEGGVISFGQQTYLNGVVACRFNLSNFTTESFSRLNDLNPLSQSGNYYPLFAIGLLDGDNVPQQHASDSCLVISNTVQLNTKQTILYKITNPPASSAKYFQAHGIIMVFAWMFFASSGIIFSRYFRKSSLDKLVCGKAAWFVGHRFLMTITAILTILGFLFILVALGGKWVGSDEEIKHYIHSITGAMVIGLAFVQPFIALFRCEPHDHYRYIYNYLHGFFGYAALTLSIVTLFLASFFKLFKNDNGRIVMTLWSIWIVFIFSIFEFIQIYFRKRNQGLVYSRINTPDKTNGDNIESSTSSNGTSRNDNEQKSVVEEKLKNILLATHILIAAILSIIMSTLIG